VSEPDEKKVAVGSAARPERAVSVAERAGMGLCRL